MRTLTNIYLAIPFSAWRARNSSDRTRRAHGRLAWRLGWCYLLALIGCSMLEVGLGFVSASLSAMIHDIVLAITGVVAVIWLLAVWTALHTRKDRV